MHVDEIFQSALRQHQAGEFAEAERLYRHIVAVAPDHADSVHLLGVLAHQAGHSDTAKELIKRAILIHPSAPEYHLNLGMVLESLGEISQAATSYRQAIALRSDFAEAYNNLGNALGRLGAYAQSADAYRQALALRPRWPAVLSNLSAVLRADGDLEGAVSACRQALEIAPDDPVSLNNLGLALQSQGELDEAILIFRKLLEIAPADAEARNNLAGVMRSAGQAAESLREYERACARRPSNVFANDRLFTLQLHSKMEGAVHEMLELARQHLSSGRAAEARTLYRQALQISPDHVEALNGLGVALAANQQWEHAVDRFRRAIRLDSSSAEAQVNLGGALAELGKTDEAVACLRKAIALEPNLAAAHFNLGRIMHGLHDTDQATEHFERAIALQPHFPEALNDLANVYKETGRIRLAIECFRRAADQDLSQVQIDSNRMFTLHFDERYDDKEILSQRRLWNDRHARALAQFIRPHENDPSPERKLRVGYVSPDFRMHCQSLFMEPLLRNHDRRQVEVFSYCGVAKPDAVTRRLAGYADTWRSTLGMNDEALANEVRQDRIDILVDLTMNMAHGRLLTFARKPAPVQVAWLAYPGTTGLDAMDYRLTDPFLDPAGTDGFYSEKSIRLPDTFWCYDPWGMEVDRSANATPLPEPGPLPALTNGFITFGCLNDFAKINDGVLDLWSRVLRQVNHSRLHLLAPRGSARRRTVEKFAAQDIQESRVEFVDRQPRRQYLGEFRRIDLCLDTQPYNGHTTSLDAFWMGVPVITYKGATVVGRAGYSQLTNLGLPELVTETEDQFVKITLECASDLPRLAELRGMLRQRMLDSPLTDAVRFSRNIEAAYRQMWRNWCMALK